MRELILLIINLTKNIELYFRFSYQGFFINQIVLKKERKVK